MSAQESRCPVDTFERGALPSVCVLTGEPSDGVYRTRFTSRIGAWWFLLLLGVVPFVIVWAVTRKTAMGRLPVTERAFVSVEHQRRRRMATSWSLYLGGLVVMIGGIVVSQTGRVVGAGLFAAGVIVVVAGFVVAARTPTISGFVEPSGRWVVLTNAHPSFAAAVDRQSRSGGPALQGG